ncbi:MAG: hypothetical protein ACREKN_09645 [Longimicrobiaceae bacterium]
MISTRFGTIYPSWIAFGWFVAAGATSLFLLGMAALGVVGVDDSGAGAGWTTAALAAGFFLGGFFTGARAGSAPWVHGVGMGLFSLLAWLLVNLFAGEPAGEPTWRSLSLTATAFLLAVQAFAAVVGCALGARLAHQPPEPASEG